MSQNCWKIPGKKKEIKLTTTDLVEFSEFYLKRLVKQDPNIRFDSTYNRVLHYLILDRKKFFVYDHGRELYRYVLELSKKTSTWIIE